MISIRKFRVKVARLQAEKRELLKQVGALGQRVDVLERRVKLLVATPMVRRPLSRIDAIGPWLTSTKPSLSKADLDSIQRIESMVPAKQGPRTGLK